MRRLITFVVAVVTIWPALAWAQYGGTGYGAGSVAKNPPGSKASITGSTGYGSIGGKCMCPISNTPAGPGGAPVRTTSGAYTNGQLGHI